MSCPCLLFGLGGRFDWEASTSSSSVCCCHRTPPCNPDTCRSKCWDATPVARSTTIAQKLVPPLVKTDVWVFGSQSVDPRSAFSSPQAQAYWKAPIAARAKVLQQSRFLYADTVGDPPKGQGGKPRTSRTIETSPTVSRPYSVGCSELSNMGCTQTSSGYIPKACVVSRQDP